MLGIPARLVLIFGVLLLFALLFILPFSGATSAPLFQFVTPSPPPPLAPVPVAEMALAAALTPLGTNLVRVWGFDSATQKFQLYDPAAALLSDLTALNRGQGYWIYVTSAQKVTLSTFTYNLSAGWNLIGWLG